MRTIFHLDLDAFFVSVERIMDPSLKGKPVIVGGDPQYGRGVVAACSYEARKYGLHSAMPIKKAYRLCPNGIYLQGHFSEYERYSNMVRKFLSSVAPVIEQASIDEFYMDFTGTYKIYGPPLLLAEFLTRQIKNKFMLPSSIGVAPNKTVAKIACDLGKPEGLIYVTEKNVKEFLSPLRIEIIPGIGKKTLVKFNSLGIYRIGDITKLPQEFYTSSFGKSGLDLWRKANGEGKEYLSSEREQKGISKETTFGEDIVNSARVEEILFKLVCKVCYKIRVEGLAASTISLKLRYSDFKTLIRSHTLKEAANEDHKIYNEAVELFRKAHIRRIGIRLIGIRLTNFKPFVDQSTLFEDREESKKKMYEAVDKIREKYNYRIIDFAVNS